MRNKTFTGFIFLFFLYLWTYVEGAKTTEVQIMAPLRAKFSAKEYRKIYLSDFAVQGKNEKDKSVNINVNKEIQETLRSEFIDRSSFQIENLKLEIPADRPPDEVLRDPAFWMGQDITDRDGGLIIAGTVEFSNFDKGGLITERVRDPRTGSDRVVTTSRDRIQLVLAIRLFLIDAKNGEKMFEENFQEEQVYGDVSNVSLPLFYDVFEKIAPKIVGILVPYRVGGSRILLEP